MSRFSRCVGLALGLLAVAFASPLQAARPLLDQHQWDRSFALFARDSSVPWRETTVRLETYSSAPVDFKAYAVDVADVIVANRPQGRVLDTNGRQPVAHWRFLPPPGYRVEGNTVPLPLGTREGLFVIEARRGNAVEQVWVNRTRIGLLTKEAPEGLMVFGTDLSTGQPLAGMRMNFLVGQHLDTRQTNREGIVRWSNAQRPRFVLAEWGKSSAFLSFLPQAPVPLALAAVRVDRSVVHSGDVVHVIGFARRRRGPHFEAAAGSAHVQLLMHGQILAETTAMLDQSGAFSTHLTIPADAFSGGATVLVNASGASAGAGLQIDSTADVSLSIAPTCGASCHASEPVPVLITAKRGLLPAAGVPLTIHIVRYPHILPPGTSEANEETWGATTLLDAHLFTNSNGRIRVVVPAAGDQLPSTLGLDVATGGSASSASTRLSLPNSAVALQISPERDQVEVDEAIAADVRAFTVEDGQPVTGHVHVILSHGPNTTEQDVVLDAHGHGRAFFRHPQFGENLLTAHLDSVHGWANDANSVTVEPRALRGAATHGYTVAVTTDHGRYRPHSAITVDAEAHGGHGLGLVTIDDRYAGVTRLVRLNDGNIHGTIPLGDPQGDVRASVAFVRDGTLVAGSTPLVIDGLGHERSVTLAPDATKYAPGAVARVAIHDGSDAGVATTAIRVSDAVPSGGADFDSAGDVLGVGGATTQNSASDDPPWHTWVSPEHSRALDLFRDITRRPTRADPPALSDTAVNVFYWDVKRAATTLEVPLPKSAGRYVISIMRMYDDGSVGAATTVVNVA